VRPSRIASRRVHAAGISGSRIAIFAQRLLYDIARTRDEDIAACYLARPGIRLTPSSQERAEDPAR
jgi:hypothetical protein